MPVEPPLGRRIFWRLLDPSANEVKAFLSTQRDKEGADESLMDNSASPPQPPIPPPSPRRKTSPWVIVGWVMLGVVGMSIFAFIGALVVLGLIFKSVFVGPYPSGEAARVSIEELVTSQAPDGWAGGITWSPCTTINLDFTSIA